MYCKHSFTFTWSSRHNINSENDVTVSESVLPTNVPCVQNVFQHLMSWCSYAIYKYLLTGNLQHLLHRLSYPMTLRMPFYSGSTKSVPQFGTVSKRYSGWSSSRSLPILPTYCSMLYVIRIKLKWGIIQEVTCIFTFIIIASYTTYMELQYKSTKWYW